MSCPSVDTLQEFISGSNSDGDTIREHLASCSTCRDRATALLSDQNRGWQDTTVAAAASEDAEVMAPDAFVGRYRIIKLLGKGGMGVVYVAHDPELDRVVAVKVLRSDRSRDDAELTSRLQREAQALARLSHAHVVAVHDVGTCAQGVFIAMEMVEGETLRDWLRQPRSCQAIVTTFVQAGRGLLAAHQAGLVHRDFKPENVLIGNDGRVRVTDFGLARVVGSNNSAIESDGRVDTSPLSLSLTRTGALLGTPAYMAPEQMSDGVADLRTDIFSFCVALYEALAGVRPFTGKSKQELLAAIVSRRIQAGRIAAAPRRIRRIVERGLAAAPSARPASMEMLLAALAPDPRERNRRLVAASVIVALSAIGVTTFNRVHEARHQCDVATHGFDSVWNAQRQATVQRAFAATGVPYAEDTWRRVAASLDDYRERWRGMAAAACEASRVRHEQSAELFDLRMECLAQRRSAANALTELFAHADRAGVEHAVAATQSLEPLDACQGAATLRAIEPLPREAARRARIDELERRLADAQALDRIGRYPDALRAARTLAGEASASGYAPLTAATLLLQGRLETADQHWPQSRHTLVDAAAAAITGRDDRALAEIFIALVRASANAWDKAALENGGHWITLAVAAIDRLGGDERLSAHLFEVEGALYLTEQRLDDALSAYRRSLELQQKDGNDSGRATTLNDLGVVLVKQNRRQEARSALEQSAALLERTLGPAHPKTGVPLYVLAQLLKDSGPLDAAETYARRALAIFQGALAPNHPRISGALDTLGEVLLSEGKTDEALATFRRALSLRRPGDPGQAEDRIGLALVLASQDKLDDAVEAIDPAAAMTLDPAHHAVVLLERGELRLRKKLFAPALNDFETALATFSKNDIWGDEGLVYALVGIGKTQLALHQANKALPPLERAVQLVKNLPPAAAAHAEFALARAIVDSKGDAARADKLAHDATARWAALGAVGEHEPGEIKSWLLARAAR